jgi:DNA-binding Xre family transcriptional regulator
MLRIIFILNNKNVVLLFLKKKQMNYDKIKILAKKQKVKVKELAKTVDISEVGLYQMIRNQSMKVETLEKISEALSVSPVIFFDDKLDIPAIGIGDDRSIAAQEKVTYLERIIDLQSDTIHLLREQLDACRQA